MRFKIFIIATAAVILLSCACAEKPSRVLPADDEVFLESQSELTREEKEALFIEELIDGMSLEERISQLFILSIGEDIIAGGYILFTDDITTVESTKAMTAALGAASVIPPFICIDEEGGAVSRLSSAGLPGYTQPPTAKRLGMAGNAEDVYIVGETIGKALSSIGVSVDFAPVADVLTNPNNTAIGSRSYGNEPELVSEMVSAFQAGLHSQGIMSAPKHFPGQGNAAGDSHTSAATIKSSLEHLSAVEYKPFIRAINEGAEFIMIGHLLAPEIEPEGLPSSLSRYFITEVLRGELGFDGIVVTDAMNMGAITKHYSSAEAAALAIAAGADMILMPEDFQVAKDGVIQANSEGRISDERIREALKRILGKKLAAGLIILPD